MFRDRTDAGHRLAGLVARRLKDPSRALDAGGGLVLGLPRGGVPVAALVAEAVGLPLDVLVVRKIGLPRQPELALGAVGEGGAVVLNDGVLSASGIPRDELDALIRKASEEVESTVADLRSGSSAPEVTGRTVVVVDDGVATGATVRVAASVLRLRRSGSVILATPVASPSTCASLESWFDEVICVQMPSWFGSVGQHYEKFDQVSIAEVRHLLGGSG